MDYVVLDSSNSDSDRRDYDSNEEACQPSIRGLIVSNSNSEEEGYGCGSKEGNIPEGKSPWCHLRCFVALQYNSFCGLVACSGIVVIAILEQAFSS